MAGKALTFVITLLLAGFAGQVAQAKGATGCAAQTIGHGAAFPSHVSVQLVE